MNCNKLKGRLGDKINAVLSACGFNFRKLLRAIALFFVFVLKMAVFAFLTEEPPKELSLQWTKETICFRKTPSDCIGSLKRQIKKLFYRRRYGKPNVGIGIWKQLFV
jgi:hypothetical protein